jgi:hypothetical protein
MSAALSRATYLRTGQRTPIELPSWSRAFKHVERPYTNIEARQVVIAHGDVPMSSAMTLAPVTLARPLFGFALAVDPLAPRHRWVLLNIVVPQGCVVEEARTNSMSTTFLARTIDVHSMIAVDHRLKFVRETATAAMPISDYAFSLGINTLPADGIAQFVFKVDAGNALITAGISLPVEVRTRIPDIDAEWPVAALTPQPVSDVALNEAAGPSESAV